MPKTHCTLLTGLLFNCDTTQKTNSSSIVYWRRLGEAKYTTEKKEKKKKKRSSVWNQSVQLVEITKLIIIYSDHLWYSKDKPHTIKKYDLKAQFCFVFLFTFYINKRTLIFNTYECNNATLFHKTSNNLSVSYKSPTLLAFYPFPTPKALWVKASKISQITLSRQHTQWTGSSQIRMKGVFSFGVNAHNIRPISSKAKKEKNGRDAENTIRTLVKNKGEKGKETLIHTQIKKELDNISNL